MPKENNYNDLVALKGPDQVRLRPGVIFGSDSVDGCRHSVFEIISNSIDSAANSLFSSAGAPSAHILPSTMIETREQYSASSM